MLCQSSASHFDIHISAPLRIQYHEYFGIHDRMPCVSLLPRDAGGQGEARACAGGDRPNNAKKEKSKSNDEGSPASSKRSISQSPYMQQRKLLAPAAANAMDQPVTNAGRWIARQLRRALWRALKSYLVLGKLAMHCNWGPVMQPANQRPRGRCDGPVGNARPRPNAAAAAVPSLWDRRRHLL
ncbi:hypothetical protein CSAL01_08323 [Colletotrichum salicis]|uniref:Uncharacterized protein n=1 Tax=Colletotrichum salicis TaxID=1209931 RepID=A0A135V3L8_9PEZI|nr:hypothetical protein CSAL01_08323 [Colletotrichum salicis]